MRKGIVLATLVALLIPALSLAGETVYGKGVSSRETMPVSELLAHPDTYVGKTVRVQGLAVGVCEHRGCWINIGSDKEGESVRVKVEDGVIVFPASILGSTVIAEGVWTANKLDLETTKKYCGAQAEQKGEEFNPDNVTACMTLYQISGTGAVQLQAAAAPNPASKVEARELEAAKKPGHQG
jgi:hypothetical protein